MSAAFRESTFADCYLVESDSRGKQWPGMGVVSFFQRADGWPSDRKGVFNASSLHRKPRSGRLPNYRV